MLRIASALVLAGFAPALAQPTTLPGPTTTVSQYGYKVLVANAAVAKDLAVTAEQTKAIRTLGVEVGKQSAQASKEAIKLPAAERAKKNIEIREEAEKAYRDGLAKHLTADQVKRLAQIRVQAEAPDSFAWPEVAGPLKLTAAQKAAAEKAAKDAAAGRGKIILANQPSDDPANAAKVRDQTRDLYRKATEDFVKGLDDAQKKAWKELTGEPFDLSKLDLRGKD